MLCPQLPLAARRRPTPRPLRRTASALAAALAALGLACLPSAGEVRSGSPPSAAGQPSAQQPNAQGPDDGVPGPAGGMDGNHANAGDVSVVHGMLQGGNGWAGSVNVASTSAQYHGLTLDALEAARGPMARALLAAPKVESAIRQVAAETGVPAGLLAGLCYQESSFDPNATSDNPNPTAQDPRDVGLTQAPEPAFNGNDWRDPLVNVRLFVNNYFLPDYQKHGSWGIALRLWNSGEVLDANDLSQVNNKTDKAYLEEILGRHCMGLD